MIKLVEGGPGSGNHGHAGRPGERGGSAGSSTATLTPKLSWTEMGALKQIVIGGMTSDRPGSISSLVSANRLIGKPDEFGISPDVMESFRRTYPTNESTIDLKNNPELAKEVGSTTPTLEQLFNNGTNHLRTITQAASAEYNSKYPNGQTLYRGVEQQYIDAIKANYAKGEDKLALRPIVSTSANIDVARQFGMGDHNDPKPGWRRANVIQMDKVDGSRVVGAYDLKVTKEAYSTYANAEQETSVLGAKTWRITGIEEKSNFENRVQWTIVKVVPNE